MRRILYACMQLPWPLDNGGKIVLFSDLAHLSTRFRIDVVSVVDSAQAQRAGDLVAALTQRLPGVRFLPPVPHPVLLGGSRLAKVRLAMQGLVHHEPYVVRKYRSPRYLALVRHLLIESQPDVVFIESVAPASVLGILPAAVVPPRVVYRAYDLFYETAAGHAVSWGRVSPPLPLVGTPASLDATRCTSGRGRT